MRPWGLSLFLGALLIGSAPAAAQEEVPDEDAEGNAPPVTYTNLAATGQVEKDFVPKGWKLEVSRKGDLDKDGREDLALVLRMDSDALVLGRTGPDSPGYNANPRILAVALAQPSGGYRTVLQDHALIPRVQEERFDDPFSAEGLSVEQGTLKVKVSLFLRMGGWGASHSTFTFRHQQGCFKLIGFDSSSMQRNTGQTEEASFNYLSGEAWKVRGSIESDTPGKKVRRKLGKKPLRCLQDVGNGWEFSG